MAIVASYDWESDTLTHHSPATDTQAAQAAATVQFDTALRTAADRARTRYAGEAARIDRGLLIALNGHVALLVDGTAHVRSQQDPEVLYRVNGHCECQDAAKAPEGRCKHRWAKSLARWATRTLEDTVLWPEPAPVTHCPTCFLALEDGEVDCSCAHLAPEQSALPQPTPQIAPEHIVEIQGKLFVKFAGLLALAHARGLMRLTCNWTYNDGTLSLAHAVAVFPFGRFEECGDASPDNVTRKVSPHFRRVALTRAKARVLRDALNIDMVSVEELAA